MFVNFNWPSVQKHINGAKNFENKKFQTEQDAIQWINVKSMTYDTFRDNDTSKLIVSSEFQT